MLNFWDYLEGVETPEQYDCFATYRDMGPRRTVAAVAQWHGCATQKLYSWAHDCSWHERVADFDIEQGKIRDKLFADQRAQVNAAWAERRALIMSQLEDIASLGAEQLLYKLRTQRATLRPNELRLIIETLTKWQNLANGDATEKVDIGVDYSNLTDEQLNQLEEIERSQQDKKNAPE